MKSKLTISIASILSVLVLVGVGFAAWVIINPNVNKEVAGNITVEEVHDLSYSLNAEMTGNIVFGATEAETTNKWLTTKDGTPESLTATLKLTVNYKENGWDVLPQKFSFKIETTNDNDKVFNALRDATKIADKVTSGKHILANPTIKYTKANESTETTATLEMNSTTTVDIDRTAFVKDDTAHTATLTVKIVFAWGGDLSGHNPYEYYNAQTYSDTLAAEAAGVLKDLYQLKNVGYKVTVYGNTTLPA